MSYISMGIMIATLGLAW